ncbi:HNH endonuclease [Streptomyces sp. NBC_00932]|uniref:HNH endonuclease n=1 Tax=Streptomyces sp. NBC_00932 TaxID=2903690 RepID=UPI003867AA3A|nr:HNH endonuclease [Streptomyces sp. NBC_00932]
MPWSSSNRRAELPPDWSAIRARVLARDGHQCRGRMRDGSRCPTTSGLEVDHIGDRHDHTDLNLQTLCSWHHKAKTRSESLAARRRRPPDRRARPAESHPGLK